MTQDTMKSQRFDTTERRAGRIDRSKRHPDAVVRSMRKTFGLLPRNSASTLLKSAQKLRYDVYCVECSFLPADDYPDGLEFDHHDNNSQHFYAFDSEDELVGYVRLVHPDSHQRFPFQSHCSTSTQVLKLPTPSRAAEVSRLMLRGDYRRRRGTGLAGGKVTQIPTMSAGARRDDAAQVLMTLYRQMYAYSRANNISHWYAAMERPLARSLLRMNIAFKSIGPQTDYYGPVTPYVASLQEVEAQVGERDPDLLTWLQQSERHVAGPPGAKKTIVSDACCPAEFMVL